MAYYLAVERVPNLYEAINIKKTTRGRKLFENDTHECTLEEIDRFTSQYNRIETLSYELYSENKVQWPNCSLAIVHINGTETLIEKNMIFSKNKKYLENPNLVTDYILNQYKNVNINFFKELALVLSENDKNRVENLTEDLERSIVCNLLFDESIASAVAKSLICNTDSKGLAKENELNYIKLHKIVVFIANYEDSLKQAKENTSKRTRTKKYTD